MASSKEIPKHKWTFAPRFRRGVFGWRSELPVKRVKEGVSEIKKIARKDPVLAAEGAVLFVEKVSPALEAVDSSSGAIGGAVNWAIDTLAPIIAAAPVDEERRDKWLARLWDAVQEDKMPYIELLPDYWGKMCVSPERASWWADDMIDTVRLSWSPEHRGWFSGTYICLSCLIEAGRYQELLDLIESAPHKSWHDRQWGVKALVKMGKRAEALRYAEASGGLNDNPIAIARACEEILLTAGLADEAYKRYALIANPKTTYLATFRAIVKKYPHKEPADILRDLAARTPGDEGKWFAAAKSIGLFREAIDLANESPCDPLTLSRAARDYKESEPLFAVGAGLAALRWLVEGYGYEITGLDIRTALAHTMAAAENAGRTDEVLEKVRRLATIRQPGTPLVVQVLRQDLGLS